MTKENTSHFEKSEDLKQAEEAFLTLLTRSEGLLQKVAWMFFKSKEERNELIAEIIYRAWEALPGFRNESDSKTWLYALARQTAINRIRNAKNKRMVELPEIPAQESSPASEIDELAVIDSLRDSEKEIVLALIEGYEYSEISKMLGIPLPNLYNRISRLKKRLGI